MKDSFGKTIFAFITILRFFWLLSLRFKSLNKVTKKEKNRGGGLNPKLKFGRLKSKWNHSSSRQWLYYCGVVEVETKEILVALPKEGNAHSFAKLNDSPIVKMFYEVLSGTEIEETHYWIKNPDSQVLDTDYLHEKLSLLELALWQNVKFTLPICLDSQYKPILIDGHHRGALMLVAGHRQVKCFVVFWQAKA